MNSSLPVQHRPLELSLLPPVFTAVFVACVLLIAYCLFPNKSIPLSALTQTSPQPLSAFYLENIAREQPNNTTIKMALAEQWIGLHEWGKANALLSEMAENALLQNQLARLTFILRLTMAYSQPKGMMRNQELAILKSKISTLLSLTFTPEQNDQLGNMALKLGAPDTALAFFQRVIQANPNQTAAYYQNIARVALASSQYVVSAQFFLIASKHQTQIELKRADIIDALKAYQSGNLMQKGVEVLLQLPDDLTDNQPMLIFLTKYAISANRPDLATKYITRTLLDHSDVSP